MNIPVRPEQRRSAWEGVGTRDTAAPKPRLASDISWRAGTRSSSSMRGRSTTCATHAELKGFETELGYDASCFFAAMSYSETRAGMQRRASHSRPSARDKLVATLGLRVPELGLVFTGRGRFVKRQDEVSAGVPVTPDSLIDEAGRNFKVSVSYRY